jgi:putative intracellular protease/amidase
MAGQPLRGRKVAILLASAGSEQVEFTEPKKALQDAGADVDVIGVQAGQVGCVLDRLRGPHRLSRAAVAWFPERPGQVVARPAGPFRSGSP